MRFLKRSPSKQIDPNHIHDFSIPVKWKTTGSILNRKTRVTHMNCVCGANRKCQ